MAEPVTIDLEVRGLPQQIAALDTIERRLISLETAGTRAVERGSRNRVLATESEAGARNKAYAALVRETEKWQAQELRAVDRAAQQRVRTEEQAAARIAKIKEQSAIMAGQFAEKQAQAEIAARQRFTRSIGSHIQSGTGRLLSGAAAMAMGALTIGGGFMVADAVRGQFAAEKQAALIVNAVTTTGKPPPGANVAGIMAKASGVSIETGMSKEDILKGTLAYSRSAKGGDFAGAMGNMGFFAKMAKVTGADIGDIGQAAGMLQSQNKNLDAKAMQQMLLNVYAQSKAGSVSMVEAAKQVGLLASTRGFYQGDEGENQRKLLALGQLAAPGGMVGDIGTYVKNVSVQALANRDKTKKSVGLGGMGLSQLGVKYDASGALESPEQMIAAVFRATKGDMKKIEGIFGLRGLPLFTQLGASYKGAGGGEAGIKAVQDSMADVFNSTMSSADLQKQFEQTMSTPGEKFAQATNQIKEAIETQLQPAIEKFADFLQTHKSDIEDFIKAISWAVQWLTENPWSGIGIIIGASIEKDIAQAMIGEAVKRALTTAIGGGVPGVGGGGGTGGALATVGTIAAIAITATTVTLIAESLIDKHFANDAEKQRQIVADVQNAPGKGAGALMTDDQRAATLAQYEKLRKERESVGTDQVGGVRLHGVEKIMGAIDPEAVQAQKNADAAQFALISQTMDQLQQALKENTNAHKGLTKELVAGGHFTNVNRSYSIGDRQ